MFNLNNYIKLRAGPPGIVREKKLNEILSLEKALPNKCLVHLESCMPNHTLARPAASHSLLVTIPHSCKNESWLTKQARTEIPKREVEINNLNRALLRYDENRGSDGPPPPENVQYLQR